MLIFAMFTIDFVINHEFRTISKYIFRYIHGCAVIITIAPNFVFLGCSLSLGVDASVTNIVFVVVAVACVSCIYMLSFYLLVPLQMTPYLIESSLFLFNPESFISNVFMAASPVALSQFFQFYKSWYSIFFGLLSFGIQIFLFITGYTRQSHSNFSCALIQSLAVSNMIASLISSANIFIEIKWYILYGIPFLLWIVLTIVFILIDKFRIKNITKKLAFASMERGRNSTEQEKRDYISTLGIRNRSTAILYLTVGLENYYELFLDWSLSKYIISEFPTDNRLLIFTTWFTSFFPSETMTLHTFISLVQKMLEPSFIDSSMRFQLHRIHIFRQSSASKEANSDFARVQRLTDAAISEPCKFWTNAANPHGEFSSDVYTRITSSRKIADAGWVEILDKYPNNARFANEYARFLLDAKCAFKDSVKWHIRANQIEAGNRHENDRMFQRFVVAYPYYLKLGIVDTGGGHIKTSSVD